MIPPLSQEMIAMIIDQASVIIDVAAKVDSLAVSDDVALRACNWTKEFVVALITHDRDLTNDRNTSSYPSPPRLNDALSKADSFLLQHTHWSWDDPWLHSRWKRAAEEQKKVWEAEEERLKRVREEKEEREMQERLKRIIKEKERSLPKADNKYLLTLRVERLKAGQEEENAQRVAETQAYLAMKDETVVFDYPTDEKWEALCNEHPLQEDPLSTFFEFKTMDLSLNFDDTLDLHGAHQHFQCSSDILTPRRGHVFYFWKIMRKAF
ncbi:hypothetical protein C8R42DRAFT_639038 [Lentinula raphanica]|nr:hypothetical protein C8R42DRAFT_639038 [Lentinula raphanica]